MILTVGILVVRTPGMNVNKILPYGSTLALQALTTTWLKDKGVLFKKGKWRIP